MAAEFANAKVLVTLPWNSDVITLDGKLLEVTDGVGRVLIYMLGG